MPTVITPKYLTQALPSESQNACAIFWRRFDGLPPAGFIAHKSPVVKKQILNPCPQVSQLRPITLKNQMRITVSIRVALGIASAE
jgi:hypothetical protein